ncbi:MAG: acyloxyacyl hydrolase [Prolixibacteraceae bacterium]|nr:acyloxyacyl hydrolase [Prolixibacteraceae bacterium]MBN2774455.1 acyloxyacyl hydrolase [Prolixibacteraceae bacterium]
MGFPFPYNKKLPAFLVSVLFFLQVCNAQEAISYSYNRGKIAEHNRAIATLSSGTVNGITVNYTLPGNPGKLWRGFYNYPDLGISFNMESFNSPRIVGNSYALRGFLFFSFIKQKKVFDLGLKTAVGLGYLSKISDPLTNPLNQVIGSHLNINGEARLYTRLIAKHFYFEYSFGFNHFSNGLLKAPNLGINLMNSNFTVGGKLLNPKEQNIQVQPEKLPLIKNEYWAFVSTGIKEIEGGNKKYSFSGLSVNYSKQVSRINKLGLGFDFSNNTSLTTLAREFQNYTGQRNLNFRYGINIHNEFLFGNFAAFGAYGLYLGSTEYYSSRRYYKTGFKYYFKNIVGIIVIRAIPLFRAEVIEFGIGYRLFESK